MSIPFSGQKSRSAGLISAIAKQLKALNFMPAEKVTVQFDPFHSRARTARAFLFFITAPKYLKTNEECVVKTSIVCDRSEPTVTVDLKSPNKTGQNKVVMKCGNLTTLELLSLYNKHITSLIPRNPEEQQRRRQIIEKKLEMKRR